jgi:AbrB family looped-hinge helix DNA binding protein
MANVVGERFQITIDKAVRRELGIKPGDLAVEHVQDGRLVIEFVPKPQRESLFGIFRRQDQPSATDWQALRADAWTWRQRDLDAHLRGERAQDEDT